MFFGLVTGLTRSQKQAAFVVIDAVVIAASLAIAVLLVTPTGPEQVFLLSRIWPLGVLLVIAGCLSGWWLGLTRMKLKAYEMRGIGRTATYACWLGTIGIATAKPLSVQLPVGTYVVFTLLVLVLSAGWRVILRHITEQIYLHGGESLRILIYGAGATGRQFAAALRHDNSIIPVAMIDDHPTLQGQFVSGLRVHAPSSIPRLVTEKRIDRVVLAMPSVSQPNIARIRHKLRAIGCEVCALPSFAALIGEDRHGAPGSPVSIDDLLGRGRLERELPGVTEFYTGRRILVSGAGGSIGSELCRQLAACHPQSVVLVDHSELALYTIEKEMRDLARDLQITAVLGSVLDERLMTDILELHDIDVVLHAAAYKHLPLVESNPLVGLQNNVFGTKILAEAARRSGVERFILVSSDKAVRPTNVMGASKRLAELVIQDLAARCVDTRFSMVRFGNVLGSSGSVIPLFEEQIARGGPVTLTDENVTRYFMTVSEAARLVLLTGSFARGGDVFVLEMGNPVPISKIARQMIEGAGFTIKSADTPDGDIEIKVTGLRPGEKLHEELLISSDMLTTPHPKILRAQESSVSEFEMATALKDLRHAITTGDEEAARNVIGRWVESARMDEAQSG
ncbi:polysaccharide biosynthesis protein [Sagittula marina]|uniref:polysaccharide biosynthesis protein n=1 Tax=Sagittula marina TaxID=943940 RepID=UPI00161173E1|nr:nucleoside-diphosphate sugar epimerase/dehydratase [Sagittula marina]